MRTKMCVAPAQAKSGAVFHTLQIRASLTAPHASHARRRAFPVGLSFGPPSCACLGSVPVVHALASPEPALPFTWTPLLLQLSASALWASLGRDVRTGPGAQAQVHSAAAEAAP